MDLREKCVKIGRLSSCVHIQVFTNVYSLSKLRKYINHLGVFREKERNSYHKTQS